ncbi:MAG TPA: T9SS type A sorting domain-containing protein, partial [Bacteroidota bacterium]|nr:T9SS type A sorting domain-containing protein [Bacteroidota bacterium]
GRPGDFVLSQNYPNPFNPSTTLEYSVARVEHVILAVYDIFGREVAVLVNERKNPGTYAVFWNATGLASGVYFSRLRAGNEERAHRMLLVK